MSDWINIAALNDIPVRGARIVNTNAGVIAVFRTAKDEIFAVDNFFEDKAGPLSEGIVHGNLVTCPIRSWIFSLETGKAQGADEGQIEIYPTRLEDGRIFLDGSSIAARSAA